MDQIILSDHWIPSEHASFVLEILKDKEKHRKSFFFQSPQSDMRKVLLKVITTLCDQLKFHCTTLHLGVYLFDAFMDKYEISNKHMLRLFGIVCLILAAKFEEKDNTIPKISELKPLVDIDFSTKTFISIEFTLLKFFDFSLVLPTTAHFVEYYILFVLCPDDEKYNIFKIRDLKKTLVRFVQGYLKSSLLEVNYITFPPSQLAAACIASARRKLGLPTWSSILEKVTEYHEYQLADCLEYLTGDCIPMPVNKCKKRPADSSDQGYATGTSIDSGSPASPKRRKQ